MRVRGRTSSSCIPSKTAGDYVREVRRRASPIFPSLRDFARAYDIVIYGLGECDRERYERFSRSRSRS